LNETISIEKRIEAFAILGKNISAAMQGEGKYSDLIRQSIRRACTENNWFTRNNVLTALQAITKCLTKDKLIKWLDPYTDTLVKYEGGKDISVIMAGNIPCAGFHDFICVLITGNRFYGYLSSSDNVLLPAIAQILQKIEPVFKKLISFREGKVHMSDAVIASGSNNTERYFRYYFGKYPNIIRSHRNSIAILNGKETEEELKLLGKDIFIYFGLGCRSISKLYVPPGYDFTTFFKAISTFEHLLNHRGYSANYINNKSIFTINREPFLDNGFLLLKEMKTLYSSIAVLHFEYITNDLEFLTEKLFGKIQCVVSKNKINFGMSQFPELHDYADGVDTLKFLFQLS